MAVVKAQKFEKVDRSQFKLDTHNVTRTGQSKSGRTRAHGNHHKHR